MLDGENNELKMGTFWLTVSYKPGNRPKCVSGTDAWFVVIGTYVGCVPVLIDNFE